MIRLLPAALALSLATAASAQSPPANLPGASDYGTVVQSYGILAPSSSAFARARAALDEGDYARARHLFAPLADGSMNPQIHVLTGYADLGAGYARKAQARFERALALDVWNAQARQGLGLAFVAQGRRDLARAELATLETARDRCAASCRTAVDYPPAIASLRRAIG